MNYAHAATEGHPSRPIGEYRMGGMPHQAYTNQAPQNKLSKWIGAGLVAFAACVAALVAYQKLSESGAERFDTAAVTAQPSAYTAAPVAPVETPAPPVEGSAEAAQSNTTAAPAKSSGKVAPKT